MQNASAFMQRSGLANALFDASDASHQKLLLSLAYLYVFLIPYPHITAIQQILFYTFIAVFLYLLSKKRLTLSLASPLTLPLALFVCWSLITVATALDKAGSLDDLYSHLVRYIILLVVFVHTFRTRKHLVGLGQTVMFSGAIYSLTLIVYWYGILGNRLSSRLAVELLAVATNTIGFMTLFAMVCSVHFFFSEQGRMKVFALVCLVCNAAASLLSQSRGTLLAMLVVFVILFHRSRKTLVCLFVLLCCFVAFTPLKNRVFERYNYDVRIGHYLYFAEMIKDYPVFGMGFDLDTMRDKNYVNEGDYRLRLPKIYAELDHPYWWPHNMLVNIAVRTGVVGLVLFTIILLVPLKMCVQCMRSDDTFVRTWGLSCLAALASYLVKGLLDQTFVHLADTIFYTMVAMTLILWREYQKPDRL